MLFGFPAFLETRNLFILSLQAISARYSKGFLTVETFEHGLLGDEVLVARE